MKRGELDKMYYNRIILGAGLYGLYAAEVCSRNQNEKILVLEKDSTPFRRATYINQARVHMGYHYPRSYSTAIKSAHYFNRFMEDFKFCVLTDFKQVYATSANFSWTNAEEFRKFCKNAHIMCDDINPNKYFKIGMCDGAFFNKKSYTYDANILKTYFIEKLMRRSNVEILYDVSIRELNIDATMRLIKIYCLPRR